MSGREIEDGTVKRKHIFTIPTVLLLILIMIPMAAIGGYYLYRTLEAQFLDRELARHTRLMEHFMEVEARRISSEADQAAEEQRSLELQDIAENMRSLLAPEFQVSGSGDRDMMPGIGGKGWSEISIRYLLRHQDGSTEKLELPSGIREEVPQDSVLGQLAADAYRDGLVHERNVLTDDGEKHVVMRTVPVRSAVEYKGETVLNGIAGELLVLEASVFTDDIRKGSHCLSMVAMNLYFVGMAVLFLLLSAIVVRSLRAIKPMNRILKEYSGERHEDAIDRNWKKFLTWRHKEVPQEIMELAETFELMGASIREYTDNVGSIRERYAPLVPDELLAFFNKADIREIAPGDEAEVYGDMFMASFLPEEGVSEEALHEQRNTVYARTLEIIMEEGGLVIRISVGKIAAVFPRKDEEEDEGGDFLKGAVERIRSISLADTGFREIRTAVLRGTCRLQVIGVYDRMAICIDQEKWDRLKQLCEVSRHE